MQYWQLDKQLEQINGTKLIFQKETLTFTDYSDPYSQLIFKKGATKSILRGKIIFLKSSTGTIRNTFANNKIKIKIKFRPYITLYTKIKSKWIIDIKM